MTDAMYSREAEEAVIGSVLINPDSYFDVAEGLNSGDFYIHKYRWAWDIFAGLKQIDMLTVTEALDERGQLAEFGGSSELTRLINVVPSSLHVAEYARIVKQESTKRLLLEAANKIAKIAHSEGSSADALTQAWGALQDADKDTPVDGIKHIADHVKEFDDSLEQSSNIYVLPTGFIELDRMTDGGLWTERTYLLMGLPKAGKSLLWAQAAIHVASKEFPVAMFSLEMPARDLIIRAISARGKLDEAELRRGLPTGQKYEGYLKQAESLADLPIYLSDKSRWTVDGMRAELHKLMRSVAIKAVFVDYLDLLADNPKYREEHENLTWKARELKRMAKDFKVAVFAIHTLTMAGDLRGGTGPAHAVDHALRLVGDKQFRSDLPSDDPRKQEKSNLNVVWLSEDFVRYGSAHGAGKMVRHPSLPLITDAVLGVS